MKRPFVDHLEVCAKLAAAKGRKRTDDNGTVGCNLWAWPCQAALHTPATKSPYRSSVDAHRHAGTLRRNWFETLQISKRKQERHSLNRRRANGLTPPQTEVLYEISCGT